MTNVLHIKNSRNKSYKHIKRGRKGKDCIYYCKEMKSCNNKNSMYYMKFCKSDNCKYYTIYEKNKINTNDIIVEKPLQMGIHERTNEYIVISKNIGTPVHVGYLHKTDRRRHKTKCIYYSKLDKLCKCVKCQYYNIKCSSSSSCIWYIEKVLNDESQA